MRARRWACVILSLAFPIAGIAWLLYFPFDEAALLDAFPARAAFVGVHRDLGDRWEELTAHPFVRALWVAGGGDPDQAGAALGDPGIARLIRLAGPHHLASARVELEAGAGEAAWMFAGWSGARTILLRMVLWSGGMGGFHPVGIGAGRRIWFRSTGNGTYFSMAVNDGRVLACWSRNPIMVRDMVHRADYRRGGGDRLRSAIRECGRVGTGPDRGRFLWQYRARLGRVSDGAAAIDWHGTNGCRVQFDADLELPWVAPDFSLPTTNLDAAVGGQELARWLGDVPQAVAVVPEVLLNRLLDTDARFQVLPRRWLQPGSPVLFAVMGDQYSGRILGLRVPALLAVFRIREAARIEEDLPGVLDAVNARFNAGLMVIRRPGDGPPSYLFEGNREGLYGNLRPDEKVCMVIEDPWAIVCSHAGSLDRVLAERAVERHDGAMWRSRLGAVPAAAALWVDLRSAEPTIRNAIAAATLAAFATAGERYGPARQQLERVRDTVGALCPLGEAVARLRWTTNHVEVVAEVGQGWGP